MTAHLLADSCLSPVQHRTESFLTKEGVRVFRVTCTRILNMVMYQRGGGRMRGGYSRHNANGLFLSIWCCLTTQIPLGLQYTHWLVSLIKKRGGCQCSWNLAILEKWIKSPALSNPCQLHSWPTIIITVLLGKLVSDIIRTFLEWVQAPSPPPSLTSRIPSNRKHTPHMS